MSNITLIGLVSVAAGTCEPDTQSKKCSLPVTRNKLDRKQIRKSN